MNLFILLLASLCLSSASAFDFRLGCGLIFIRPEEPEAKPKPVPLTAVGVHADVRGWTVGVSANLTYRNLLDENIECQFVFPLADTAAVYQLDAVIAGRRLSATVKERKEAEAEYKEAVSGGRKAVLMESQIGSPDVYRLKLGNLPPNETAAITVSYVQPIDHILDDGLLSMTLPVVLNPRYVPKHQLNDSEVMKEKFHSRVPYIAVSEVKYRMSFSANITLGLSRSIADVKPRHPNDTLKVEYGEDKLSASVSLTGEFIQDHDFQLLISPSTSLKPMVYVEPGREPITGIAKSWLNYDVAAAWFEPEKSATEKKSNNEYWLVIDRSGSMWGDKITDAKSALALFVKSMPFGCKFNIVGFGSNFEVLFNKGVVDYSKENVQLAMAHADKLEADLGGTEVLGAFEYIYKQALRNDTAEATGRFVILLTDGEVSNTDQVIAIVRKNAATTRVFSIGIGEGASTALVNGVARASNGLSEFVRSSGDRMQAKVISLLKATTGPSAIDVKLEWQVTGGDIKSTVPTDLSSTVVYAGGSVTQYAVIERQQEKDVQGLTKFSANYNGNATESRLDFQIPSSTFSEMRDTMPLHRLSAKAVLTKLTDDYYHEKSDSIRQEAVAISLATGVLCEFTAFVAVDKDAPLNATARKPVFIDVERPTAYKKKQEEAAEQFKIVSGPHYYSRTIGSSSYAMAFGGMGRIAGGHHLSHHQSFVSKLSAHPPMVAMAPAPLPPPPPAGSEEDMLEAENLRSDESDDSSSTIFGHYAMLTTQTPARSTTSTISQKQQFEKLVRLQTFEGYWLLTDDLVPFINLSSITSTNLIRDKISEVVDKNFSASDEFIATATAVSLLRNRFSAFKAEWQMIEQKAISYLRMTGYSGDIDQLSDAIAKKLAL